MSPHLGGGAQRLFSNKTRQILTDHGCKALEIFHNLVWMFSFPKGNCFSFGIAGDSWLSKVPDWVAPPLRQLFAFCPPILILFAMVIAHHIPSPHSQLSAAAREPSRAMVCQPGTVSPSLWHPL